MRGDAAKSNVLLQFGGMPGLPHPTPFLREAREKVPMELTGCWLWPMTRVGQELLTYASQR